MLWVCKCSECHHPSRCTCSDLINASGMAGWLRAAGEHVPSIKRIGVAQFLSHGTLPARKVCATIIGTRLEFNLSSRCSGRCQCALKRVENVMMPEEQGVELVKLALEACIEQTRLMCGCSEFHVCTECNGFYFS
jgi:hypothetical protein